MGKVIAILALQFTATSAFADYTADYKMTTTGARGGASRVVNGRVQAKPSSKKLRMDMNMAPAGEMTTIADTAARKVYMIMHSSRTIVESDPARWEASGGSPCLGERDIGGCLTRMGYTRAGNESANGHPCEVFAKTSTSEHGSNYMKIFHPTDLSDVAFVRMQISKTPSDPVATQIDIENIRNGSVPDSAFALPTGYARHNASEIAGSGPGAGRGAGAPNREAIMRMIEAQRRARH